MPEQTEEKELSPEEADALASVTLPVKGWAVKTAKVGEEHNESTLVVLLLEMVDEEGNSFFIQPFLPAESAVRLANTVLETQKEN